MKTDFKYLGTVISNDLLDDTDISRQMELLYARTNFLIRKFYNLSYSVKLAYLKHIAWMYIILLCGINFSNRLCVE